MRKHLLIEGEFSGVREGKEGKHYASFVYMGGEVSALVDEKQAKGIKLDTPVAVSFEARTAQGTVFGRPQTVFVPGAIVDMVYPGGK